MKRCSVLRCVANSQSNPDLCYHGLPISEGRRKMWLKLIKFNKKCTAKKSIWVCSLHFLGGRKACRNSDPTIFPWSKEWPSVIDSYNKSICEASVDEPCSFRPQNSDKPLQVQGINDGIGINNFPGTSTSKPQKGKRTLILHPLPYAMNSQVDCADMESNRKLRTEKQPNSKVCTGVLFHH